MAHDQQSGCLLVATAHLAERADLSARLGLARERTVHDPATLILQAWLRWGEECPEHLHGEFAFAVWDQRRQLLFCARDVMGVQPLYVHFQRGRIFAFASRARALLRLPGIPATLNEGRIADTLVSRLEGVDKRCTFYQAILRLPPAHCVSIRPDNYGERRYWKLEPGRIELPSNDAQWAAGLNRVLERAVSRQLDDESKVGCMLSGGMDSSALAVIAADQLRKASRLPLHTFSSVSNGPECLETRAIEQMLTLPGFAPTLIDPTAIEA